MSRTVTVSVVGVSGREAVKGNKGVGKSLICNRFVRGDFDEFFTEHCSVLSQTDFCGSPVINCDHWLYWGERQVNLDDSGHQVTIRVIEQTEFLDDETYEPIAGTSSSETYMKRCCQIRLESRDKLMYIQKEQLGLEAEFKQQILPDGKCTIDAFIFVFDSSRTEGRSFESQCSTSLCILSNVIRTKKPVVVAFSQADSADEEARKALQSLLSQRDIKNTHISVVEVSALMNVNVDELFVTTACLALRNKLKLKILSFSEAHKIVTETNRQVKIAFISLLKTLLPFESWPSERLSWTRLVAERCLDRQPDYCNFMRIYGKAAAKKVYEIHINEAREHWMATRIHALVPNLPRVFAALLEKSDVAQLSWSTANQMIHSHPLFDEFFQPLGQLEKQLVPLPSDHRRRMSQSLIADNRIPAEILLRFEARQAFELYKHALKMEQRKERLEEEFEFLLSDTPQVTPGKPLQDVTMFLQGFSAYDSLPPGHAAMVYDRFQHHLVKRAESDFYECMLENIELFVNIVRKNREQFVNDDFTVCEGEVERIKDVLQDDFRFRQLSRLFELRDTLIRRFITLLVQHSLSACPAFSQCAELAIRDAITLFFQKKKQLNLDASHLVEISVHGEVAIVAQFIMDMKVLLRNEPFQFDNGPAMIRCYDANEITVHKSHDQTLLFLLDSGRSIDYANECTNHFRINSNMDTIDGSAIHFPPVYVLVDNTCQHDSLPDLYQEGFHLAENTGGIFIGARSNSDGLLNVASDCSSMFGRSQLLRICSLVCASQLNRREGLKIQLSILCGDPFSIETVLIALLGMENDTLREIYDPCQIGEGIIPIDVYFNKKRFAVDLHLCAYHSWLSSNLQNFVHGHVVVYSVRRAASFAHARSAVARVLDDGHFTLSGEAILLVAVLHDYFSDEETNLLLVEGSELATSIGASFIAISPDANSCQTVELAEFFEHIRTMVLKTSTLELPFRNESTPCANIDQRDSGCFRKDSSRMYGPYTKSHSTGTLLSQSISGESTISAKPFEELMSASSAPTLRCPAPVISTGYSPNVISPLCLPVPYGPPPLAPLAMPETVDVSTDYSMVQDALTDDHHFYATLDFCTTTNQRFLKEDKKMSWTAKKDKKHSLPPEVFSYQSTTEPSASPPTTTSQPSSASSPTSTRRSADIAELEQPVLPKPPGLKPGSQRTETSSMRPQIPPKPTTSLTVQRMTCSMPSRSITMDVINRESVMKARRIFAQSDAKLPILKQSLSVESFADLMGEKKKRFRFVRKVATSFRFKKSVEMERGVEKSINLPSMGSRSLPQSPQVERKARKPTYIGPPEKTSAFSSWLSSRSPKRTQKAVVAGVVGATDTLQTLAEKNSGIPLFLMRCVEFIEKDGGLQMEGLYRVPGNQAQLSELEKAFREKGDIDIASLDMPVHVVATAVKNFLSCLSEPLIPIGLHKDILDCLNRPKIIEHLRTIMDRLTPVNRKVLIYFTSHLHRVASSPNTAMDIHNLSKVLFPTLFRPQFHDFVEMSTGTAKFQQATEVILENAYEIFQMYQAQSMRV